MRQPNNITFINHKLYNCNVLHIDMLVILRKYIRYIHFYSHKITLILTTNLKT
jgi:hypothetical protein